jgi:predicted anti-sigma-YlaC factor YlaD
MKCREVYKYVCTNLDQNLNSARCRRIKKHLSECPDCAAYLDSLRKTISLYREYPTPHVPRSVHKRLFRVIHTIEKESPGGLGGGTRSKSQTKK